MISNEFGEALGQGNLPHDRLDTSRSKAVRRISNPDRICDCAHLFSKLGFSCQVKLLDNSIVCRLENLDLGTTHMMARCQMICGSTTKGNCLNAGIGSDSQCVCGDVLNRTRWCSWEVKCVLRLPSFTRSNLSHY